jgi:quinol-cytochrome oxidoreductase complex cytochrome b subunit
VIIDFVKHLFPRVVRSNDLKLTYTFCLGGLAFITFLLLVVSGLLLLFYYRPDPNLAYASILYLESNVAGGFFVRNLHSLASDVFLGLLFLHCLRVLLTGAYLPPRELNWVLGLGLLILAIFEAYTGGLLPMDQAAFWATETGLELLTVVPSGNWFAAVIAPDGPGGVLTLLRFYVLHIVFVPGLTLALTLLHFYLIRKKNGMMPYL